MTAFVTFIKTYAVWIYLLSGVGILIVAKMLFDARRLARTTFFSLDQERAGEQYYRGIALLLFLILMVCSVTAINVFVAPAIPSPESPVVRVATPTFVVTFPAIPSVLPTNTLVAKVTDAAVPNTPSIAIPAVTRTPTKPPAPPALPTATPFALPAPVLIYERNKDPLFNGLVVTGEGQMRTSLIFKWEWNCDQCVLGPNDKFVVNITFTDKLTGLPRAFGGSTLQKTLTLNEVIGGQGGEYYQKAKDDLFHWNVQVKRSPGDQPVSPPSETWRFTWH